jgi:hypothetical protein
MIILLKANTRYLEARSETNVQDNVKECINLFELCNQLVDRLGLFSKNESIDDVNTSELK